MKNLNTYITEAQNKSGLLGDLFDFNDNLTIYTHSNALDRNKIDSQLKDSSLWDDHKVHVNLQGYWNGVKNDSFDTLKNLSNEYKKTDCAASEIIDLIRILANIKIKNANSVRSVVGEVKKTIISLISDDASEKSVYIWSTAKNDDDSYSIEFDEKFGRSWMTVCVLTFRKK